jgi:beta-lactamase superfamily II metal-dependent hydrolase
MKAPRSLFHAAAIAHLISPLYAAQGGQVRHLEPWTEGTLDIHHISTGRGESTFFHLPDGTTLLVDAGAYTGRTEEDGAPAVPNDSKKAGEWIARYIKALLKDQPAKLDYTVLSHFDEDHIGEVEPGLATSQQGGYVLSGVTEMFETLPSAKIIDRGYPDYAYPKPLTAAHIVNYKKFVDYQTKEKNLKAERFKPGHTDQITLLKKPATYPTFKVQNLSCNGDVWTGQGNEVKAHFPPLESLGGKGLPSENSVSLSFKLSYGKFDYFTGGDTVGVIVGKMPAWYDLETPIAKVTGPVEALKLNHHGYRDSQNEFFLKTLRPRVNIILSWDSHHPHAEAFPRMASEETYPGPRDFFITYLNPKARKFLGDENVKRIQGTEGHVVLRVPPDGNSFQVHVLNDRSEDRFIKASFGPYACQ